MIRLLYFAASLILCSALDSFAPKPPGKTITFQINVEDYDMYKKAGYGCFVKYAAYEDKPVFSDEREYLTTYAEDIKLSKNSFVYFKFYLKKNNEYADSTEWIKQKPEVNKLLDEQGEKEKKLDVAVSFTKEKNDFGKAVDVKDFLDDLKRLLINNSLEQLQDSSQFVISQQPSLGTFIFWNKADNSIDSYAEETLSVDKLGTDSKIKNRIDASVTKFVKHDLNTSAKLSTIGPLKSLSVSLSKCKYSEITVTLKNLANRKLKDYGVRHMNLVAADSPNVFFRNCFSKLKNVSNNSLSNYKLFFVSNLVTLDSLISTVKKYNQYELGTDIDVKAAQIFKLDVDGKLSASKTYEEQLVASDFFISFEVDDISSYLYAKAEQYNEKKRSDALLKQYEQSKKFYAEKKTEEAKKLVSLYKTFYDELSSTIYPDGELMKPIGENDMNSIDLLVVTVEDLLDKHSNNDSTKTVAENQKIFVRERKHNTLLKVLKSTNSKYQDYAQSYASFDILVQKDFESQDATDFKTVTMPAPAELLQALYKKQ
jgi:hypothetical protein